MLDLIYITNLPSFYKINLLNRIASKRDILVIFTHNHSSQRNEDFYNGVRDFKFISLANKSFIEKIFVLMTLLKKNSYKKCIISGWDQLIFWIIILKSPKNKNQVVIESSIYESKISGIKGVLKKMFLNKISKAFVSGKSQANLVLALGFKGEICNTKGVGIFNIIPQPKYKPVSSVVNFIFVGRLSSEKNLKYLIETFNLLPDLHLNIIGFGPQEHFLKSIAKDNIYFHGAVPNQELYLHYQQNDVFILPSISEPWGMVVEEALNNGLPVIVSDKVGCAEEIVNKFNGIVFETSEIDGLKNAIYKIQEIEFYNMLRFNISSMDFEKIAEEQVNFYL